MITITRRTAHAVRAVFRRAFGMTREVGPALLVRAGPDGLSIRARRADAAVEYREPQDGEPEQFTMPLEALDACEAKNDIPVSLEPEGGRVVVQWRDGAVPQLVQFDQPDPPGEFPELPAEMTANPPELLRALRDACATTDPGSLRYALGCMQLRGDQGKIVVTDGRQLLVQSGFAFPWAGDILVPAGKVYGCPCLATDQTVHVGRSEDWFSLVTGPWTLHFRLDKDGRFPSVEDHVRKPGTATSTLCLTDEDAGFLADTIRRLPGDGSMNAPVTVDLNGRVAVRAKGDGQTQATEIVLSNSVRDGVDVRFNTNRMYLARAAKLGFRQIELDGAEAPTGDWSPIRPPSAQRLPRRGR